LKVIIFSHDKQLKEVINNKSYDIAFYTPGQIKKILSSISNPVLVYYDISGLGDKLFKQMHYLANKENIFYGILDPNKKVENIMELFFMGAVDYLAKGDIKKELSAKRFKKVIEYLKKYRIDYIEGIPKQQPSTAKAVKYKTAPHGWKDIIPGKEYTFSIMFIELDRRAEMEKKYGKKNLQTALNVFKNYIERNITPFGGRIWMWFGFGGIILFPFDAQECKSVLSGFRIVLYKFMHDVEESHFPNFISFRLTLLLGNIVYQEKDKGKVISDSINTIFHLGRKYTEPGNFYLTEDILKFAPPPLKQFFIPVGKFEGRALLKMRQPVL